jgi:predicted dehydrogenase
VPETLDWDKWLGVSPERPFKQRIYHPYHWRGWLDFGGGTIGDFGCHILDTPFKALELTAPISIRAQVPEAWAANEAWNQENWPDWEIIEYWFAGTKFTVGKTIRVAWYDGGKQPPVDVLGTASTISQLPGSGAAFIGEEGVLLLPHVGSPQLFPPSRFKGWRPPEVRDLDHYHAFVDACLGRGETGSSFSYAAPLTEATLLGTVAVRCAGETLEWNAESMRVVNNDSANRYVSRTYRPGW